MSLEKLPVVANVITIASVLGALALIYGMVNNVATKEYHEEDMGKRDAAMAQSIKDSIDPVMQSAREAESNTLPPRIRNLLVANCQRDGLGQELNELLNKLLARYEELNGRKYRVGTCRDGAYYNAMGVRQE